MKSGHWLEGCFYLLGWLVETLLIKYWISVESWLICVFLAITVGSLVLWAIQHAPDLLD